MGGATAIPAALTPATGTAAAVAATFAATCVEHATPASKRPAATALAVD